jgi:ABC-2 type transport system ATP-binding protein
MDASFAIARRLFARCSARNGAGKIDAVPLVTPALQQPHVGSIRVFGFEVRTQPSEALARIGAILQQRTLDLDLTVADNLRYHAALHGMSRRDAKDRIQTELGRAGLLERLNDKVRSLSGGQMRRIEIAGALLHRPRLLLLDEPTVGVDIGSRQASSTTPIACAARTAWAWATHLIDDQSGDDVVVLHQGRVLAHGDSDGGARPMYPTSVRPSPS